MWTILLATDGSEDAAAAREVLETLDLPADTRIEVVTALPPVALPTAGYVEGVMPGAAALLEVQNAEREFAEKALAATAARLAGRGWQVGRTLRDGDPAHVILEQGEACDADLIVVGSKGLTGLDAFLLGSVARNVAKHAHRPVLVGRAPESGMREVLLTVDDSKHAADAARYAATLPLPEGTHLTVLHVVRPHTPFAGLFPTDREEVEAARREVHEQLLQAGQALAERQAAPVAEAGRPFRVEVREGDPTTEILAAAQERGADLILAGARGVSLIEGLRVGSVADRLLKEARCSVLIVH